ncbi:MAG: GTP 3',8-cyclase MoaA [Armatimonadota bacterium]
MTRAATQPGITLRISVTDRCDIRCRHCLPAEGVTELLDRSDILGFEEITRVVQAVTAVAPSVALRITGGEPLLRRDIDRLVRMLSDLETGDLALTTNGRLLADLAPRLTDAGLRRVNISLDTLRPERYAYLTRGASLNNTLAGIEAALASDLNPVKLNAVVLRGINDDEVCSLVRFAAERGSQMRFIELMPIGEATARHGEWFVPTAEVRGRLKQEFEIGEQLPDTPAPARTFRGRCRETGLSGIVGFISPVGHPFCDGCRRLRLTSWGELLGCLMHGSGLDVRSILRSGAPDAQLEDAVRSALALKAAGHRAHRRASMATVGG